MRRIAFDAGDPMMDRIGAIFVVEANQARVSPVEQRKTARSAAVRDRLREELAAVLRNQHLAWTYAGAECPVLPVFDEDVIPAAILDRVQRPDALDVEGSRSCGNARVANAPEGEDAAVLRECLEV